MRSVMGLYEFNDDVFLEYKGYWFVWEPAWESFRPIDGVRWTGTHYKVDDRVYCSDPTSEYYGYGMEERRQLCGLLNKLYEQTPLKVSVLPMDDVEWFRDRWVSFEPCAPRTITSWKHLVRNRPRTCRNAPRGKKFTRRALNKTK
jgi:hypothetical protein